MSLKSDILKWDWDTGEVLLNVERLKRDIDKTAGGGAYKWATEVMRAAKQYYTPYVTGTLIRSGFTLPPSQTKDNSVTFGFGAKYAAAVHERDPYLRMAIDDAMPVAEKLIAQVIQDSWRSAMFGARFRVDLVNDVDPRPTDGT